jgi:REP element-mobilizing transposase RayT
VKNRRKLADHLRPGGGGYAFYHVFSRVVNRRPVFDGEAEREHFRALVRRLSAFSGVECVTFCVLGDQFHLLLAVPEPVAFRKAMSDTALFARLGAIYPPAKLAELRDELRALGRSDPARAAQVRERYLRRMANLSRYLAALKMQFSRWFNSHHDREGTLWAERFRSVVLEDERAVEAARSYIDLVPVRAGLITDAADYPWCGYGEASAGSDEALRSLLLASGPGQRRWA